MTDEEIANLPPLMDSTTAARLLGVTRQEVSAMCGRGEIYAVRCGRVWRINRDRLLALCGMKTRRG